MRCLRDCGPLYSGRTRYPVAWRVDAHISDLSLRHSRTARPPVAPDAAGPPAGSAGGVRTRRAGRRVGRAHLLRDLALPPPVELAVPLLLLLGLSVLLRSAPSAAASGSTRRSPGGSRPRADRDPGPAAPGRLPAALLPAAPLDGAPWRRRAGAPLALARGGPPDRAGRTVGRNRRRRTAGGLAGCRLAALIPFLTIYAQEARMYSLVALLSVLACGSFVSRRRRRRPAAPGAPRSGALGVAVYARLGDLLRSSGSPLAATIHLRARWRDALLPFVGSAAVLFLPWLPTLLDQAREQARPGRRRRRWRLCWAACPAHSTGAEEPRS